jgi:primosomal protein N' (replication factor Y)
MSARNSASHRVCVALPLPVDKTYTYRIPPESASRARPGHRVVVPFGSRILTGIITGEPDEDIPEERLRFILDLPDADPLLPDDLLDLTRWVSRYYLCSWGETLKAALPAGFLQPGLRTARLGSCPDDGLPELTATERKVVEILQKVKSLTPTMLSRKYGVKQSLRVLTDLQERGLVKIQEAIPKRGVEERYLETIGLSEDFSAEEIAQKAEKLRQKAPRRAAILAELIRHSPKTIPVGTLLKRTGASRSSLNSLLRTGIVRRSRSLVKRYPTLETLTLKDEQPLPDPNPDQRRAIESIAESVNAGENRTFLLYGVTGSGKTLVYQKVIEKVLAGGGGVLVLIPEIALTPQMVSRFRARFGKRIGLQHSAMSAGERADVWRGIRRGDFSVVIGARSAVFAPVKNLKLIVVDEEGDSSFKQQEPNPRYNARDVALVRARRCGAVTVLGSATPSLESFHNAQKGRYTLLHLPERVDGVPMPQIRFAPPAQKGGKIIGTALKKALLERFKKGEQAILLHNRRGFFTYAYCTACGYLARCRNCEITLVFHRNEKQLRCHVCGFRCEPILQCPECKKPVRYLGAGTERVEEELSGIIPIDKIARLDLDTAQRRGAHQKILKDFAREKYTVLLGTKMVARGHDYPKVTLVGVVSADKELAFPDFRSDERAFVLLLQAAGRAGRAADDQSPGKVLVQTWMPDHPVLRLVKNGDYEAFYRREIAVRKNLNYPPEGWMVLVVISSTDEADAQQAADEFIHMAKRRIPSGEWMGPQPAFRPRIKRRYRYQIILKTELGYRTINSELRRKLQLVIEECRKKAAKGVQFAVDVDPIQLM